MCKNARAEAEICRAFLAMWDLPRSAGTLPRLGYPWSQKLYRNLRVAWYLDRSQGWFAGFAPADDPQVAFAVLVEHGGSGGASAAPIATSVMQQYLGQPEESE